MTGINCRWNNSKGIELCRIARRKRIGTEATTLIKNSSVCGRLGINRTAPCNIAFLVDQILPSFHLGWKQWSFNEQSRQLYNLFIRKFDLVLFHRSNAILSTDETFYFNPTRHEICTRHIHLKALHDFFPPFPRERVHVRTTIKRWSKSCLRRELFLCEHFSCE